MDCSPPGSSVHGISQARILEWVAIFFLSFMQILSCSMWDLVPRPGMEPRPPALGEQRVSPWITREAPEQL